MHVTLTGGGGNHRNADGYTAGVGTIHPHLSPFTSCHSEVSRSARTRAHRVGVGGVAELLHESPAQFSSTYN